MAHGSSASSPGVPARELVTLIVAMRNESGYVERCLASILAQTYPAELLEVLVYDGGSTDGSDDVARQLLQGRPLADVRDNPQRIQAAAWNLGSAAAKGEIVGIVSAHAELAPSYVAAAVAALQRTKAEMVGGPVRAMGSGLVAEAIARATSTAFGAGGARFRLTDHEEQVDTVYMGLARREVYVRFPFDLEMVRNQDDELSYRLLDAGLRIVCDPAISSVYRSRSTLLSLARQYADYGFWKVRVLQKHPSQARLRHLVPPAFVVGVAGSLLLLVVDGAPRVAGVVGLAVYVAADVVASVAATRGRRSLLTIIPIVYPILHLAYGTGFIIGLGRFRRSWGPGGPSRVLVAISGRART